MKTKYIDFSKYSSIKIGSSFEVALLEDANDFNESYYLIGSCNNILIGPNPPKLMKLSKKYDFIFLEGKHLLVGASTPTGKIVSFCKRNNIGNFEFLSHLPGTLGGLVKMNAGLKEYEIFKHLVEIKTISGVFKKDDIAYGYRYADIKEPVLEVKFEICDGFDATLVEKFKRMRRNQPKEPSAGSCFKNPDGDYAGRLIEEVGLKGIRVGDMEFSTKHANFLINHANGSFEDAIYLIKEAKKRVYEKFAVELELEIKVLDENYMSQSMI